MFLKPKPGVIVRDPVTMQPLPAEGVEVSGNRSHWIRRIEEGSVEEVKRLQATEKPAPKEVPAEKAVATETSSKNTK